MTVTGDVDTDITPMDIDEVIKLILEGLIPLENNPDYPDLMESTLSLAEIKYGPCSDEFLTILRSWEQICVETGHRMVDPPIPCLTIINAGPTTICEESNQFKICTSESVPNVQQGRWRITGRNSTSFSSILGMQGNSQYGGSCLDVIQIPSMPYCPQEITIAYWHPLIGETVSLRIQIEYCTGNKPSCDQYYETLGMSHHEDQEFIRKNEVDSSLFELLDQTKSGELNLIIYDIMGNVVSRGYSEYFNINPDKRSQVLIFTFWDQYGNSVMTKKNFVGY